MKNIKIFLISVLLIFNSFVSAQTGTWNILHVRFPINKSWDVLTETQIRSLSFYNNFHYYEYKGAVSYVVKDRKITTGIGSYRTFQSADNFRSPASVKEIRSWFELSLKDPGFVLLEHRYRIEQRFTNLGYRNRFRYRFGGIIDLNKTKNIFLSTWTEVFFTNTAPYFERIRTSGCIGYKINQLILQLGYLNQFDYKINDEIGRNFLLVSFRYDIKNKGKSSPLVPFQEG